MYEVMTVYLEAFIASPNNSKQPKHGRNYEADIWGWGYGYWEGGNSWRLLWTTEDACGIVCQRKQCRNSYSMGPNAVRFKKAKELKVQRYKKAWRDPQNACHQPPLAYQQCSVNLLVLLSALDCKQASRVGGGVSGKNLLSMAEGVLLASAGHKLFRPVLRHFLVWRQGVPLILLCSNVVPAMC